MSSHVPGDLKQTKLSHKKSSRIIQALIVIVIIAMGALALKPRLDDLKLAYNYVTAQIFKDIYNLKGSEPTSSLDYKEPSSRELKEDLLSFDTEIRHKAIEKIIEKKDTSFIPLLIKLFNDVSSVDSDDSEQKKTTADVAREAVVKLYRENITREPGNLRILIPLLDAASKGTRAEQLNSVQVIAELREPTGLQVLDQLSKNSSDKAIIVAASKASKNLTPEYGPTQYFESLSSTQSILLFVVVISCGLIVIFIIWNLFRRPDPRLIFVGLISISISLGLAILVNTEIERVAGLNSSAIRAAATSGHPILIRSKIYAENCQYPGDSRVCHELAGVCDIRNVQSLIGLSDTEPDDLQNYRRLMDTSSKWILSRLIATNANKPCIDSILRKADTVVCKELLKTINELRITSDRIYDLLWTLSSSEFQDCDEEIFKCYEDLKSRPVWEY